MSERRLGGYSRISLNRVMLSVAALALCVASVSAQPTPQTVADGAAEAMEWVGKPSVRIDIEGYAPTAEIEYRVYDTPRPLRLWIAKIDLSNPAVRLAITEPVEFDGEDAKFETRCADTLEFARQRGVQLAINTSAFDPFRPRAGMPMDVVGLAAVRGQRFSDPDERFGAMYISRDGRVSLKGAPLPCDDLWHVIPGFRMVLDDGELAVAEKVHNSNFGRLNPRTAAGVDKSGRVLWLVVADGRQKGVSMGITLVEMGCLFKTLGAWDALNLDGGGSSAFVLEKMDGCHQVVNTPVGRGKPHTLRQVAGNLGFYLPKAEQKATVGKSSTMREAVVRLAGARRGGGYKLAGGGVARDICYDGETVLKADSGGTYCCGATLELFLDAYCQQRYGSNADQAEGKWFQNWPREKFVALQQGWFGTEGSAKNPLIPEKLHATLREKQVFHMLPWSGLAKPVEHYRLLERGDFVQFWRKNGTGHSVVFWGRDRDVNGKERLWYWSSQKKPRYAYPQKPGGESVKLSGYGINWEYIGDEIDPERIYGVRLIDQPTVTEDE